MSTRNENEEHTLCVGSMLRKLKLKDIWERSHHSLPAWLTFAPCRASCFAQTDSVKIKSALMKNYSSRFTLPGQPHRSKETTCAKRLLRQFIIIIIIILYICLMIN